MVITTTDIQLFQILKQKLGEQEAEALVGFVDSRLKENSESNLKVLATREDVAKLDGKVEKLIAETKTDIARTKADIIKWMFLFWIGQIAFTFGFILLFIKK